MRTAVLERLVDPSLTVCVTGTRWVLREPEQQQFLHEGRRAQAQARYPGVMGTFITRGGCSAALLRAPRPRREEGPARVVAVSGGIGSGKSSVTSAFASLGAFVVDADAIAREIMEPGQPTLSQVAARFGADLIRGDGSLDRPALARRVFEGAGSSRRVAALNAITHPAIERRAWEILRSAPEGSVAVYDIPLLVEADHATRFDAIVIVDAPVEERIRRLEGRGVAATDARARIRAQASSEQRRAIAHVWIDNCGSADELSQVAADVYELWLSADR